MIALHFDTETTGLIKNKTLPLDKQPEIIEFYAALVDLSTSEVLEEFECLIKPQYGVPEIITKITGLTASDLKDCKSFIHYAPEIKSMIEKAEIVISHNASFDKGMVDIEFKRIGQTIKWQRVICTVEQTIHMKGYRLNMQALHNLLFGFNFAEAHRAKNDVNALISCTTELFKRGII